MTIKHENVMYGIDMYVFSHGMKNICKQLTWMNLSYGGHVTMIAQTLNMKAPVVPEEVFRLPVWSW